MTASPASSSTPYAEKFALLNRSMRWEVADLLRDANLDSVNRTSAVVEARDSFYVRYGKRALDVIVAAVALVVTLPINVLIALVTVVTLGRPVLFMQKRLGKGGQLFTLVKFRNMREAFDENGHPLPGHMRVTKLGKVMRKTSLDELLNFWSILRGDMSLIGPRPLVPEYGARFSRRHAQRMSVRPGLECPLPIHSDGSYDDQFEHDIWYVQNVSLATDLRLTWSLVRKVFDRHHSAVRGASRRGAFLGYTAAGKVVDSHNVPQWALDAVLRRHGLLTENSSTKSHHHAAKVGTDGETTDA